MPTKLRRLTPPKRIGRPPTLRTNANAQRICELLAEGKTLREIAGALGVDAPKIARWVREDQSAGGSFWQRYARAMELRCDVMLEDIIGISDEDCMGRDGYTDNAEVQRSRLRVESRKWVMSKMMPKKYGDKVTQELTSDPSAPLVTRIELVPVDPIVRAATALPRPKSDD